MRVIARRLAQPDAHALVSRLLTDDADDSDASRDSSLLRCRYLLPVHSYDDDDDDFDDDSDGNDSDDIHRHEKEERGGQALSSSSSASTRPNLLSEQQQHDEARHASCALPLPPCKLPSSKSVERAPGRSTSIDIRYLLIRRNLQQNV